MRGRGGREGEHNTWSVSHSPNLENGRRLGLLGVDGAGVKIPGRVGVVGRRRGYARVNGRTINKGEKNGKLRDEIHPSLKTLF